MKTLNLLSLIVDPQYEVHRSEINPFGFCSPFAGQLSQAVLHWPHQHEEQTSQLIWFSEGSKNVKWFVYNSEFLKNATVNLTERKNSQEMSSCINMVVLTRTPGDVNCFTCFCWLIRQTEVYEVKNWYIWVGCHFFFRSFGWCFFMSAILCYCLTLLTGNIYSLVTRIKPLWEMDCVKSSSAGFFCNLGGKKGTKTEC